MLGRVNAPSPALSRTQGLRRVLEGRVELLEQFLPHHRALYVAVAQPSWRGRTLEQLDALRELELNDAALDAAVSVAV
ncbi:MAG TPA: hypothetical protein VK447_03360, partial [Myxococcaceae bacterium]|nr:hypothetical protein [Myxococcaceae bacterium]